METSRGVSEAQAIPLPDGLAQLPPGPGVAVLLASIERSTVASEELVDLVRARARLLAHVQAELFADIVEAARGADAPAGSVTRSATVQWESAEFIGWALCYSGAYGSRQLELAQALVERLPMVHQALREGRLDYGRAAAFADALSEVDDEVARRFAQRLLDKGADRMTLASLREKLRYHIDKHDPESKRRRYRRRVAERTVWLREKDDGTAILAGSHLPPHRAGAAYDRIDRLARAARASGDARTLGQLRADAMLDLLCGRPFQLAPSVDPLTAEADAEHEAPSGEPHPPGEPIRRRVAGEASEAPRRACGAAGRNGTVTGTERRLAAEARDEPTDRIDLYDYDWYCLTDADHWWLDLLRAMEVEGSRAMETDGNDASTGSVNDRRRYAGLVPDQVLPADQCGRCGGVVAVAAAGAVEIQVKLSTLVGLDDDPALIPEFGPILAEIARRQAHDPLANPTWRWSVFAETGDLLHHGHTRVRPLVRPAESRFKTGNRRAPQQSAGGRSQCEASNSRFTNGNPDPSRRLCTCPRVRTAARRNILEIQLTPQALAEFVANPQLAPEWTDVVADIARQVATDAAANPPDRWSQTDEHGTPLAHGHTGRFPDAIEDAFVRARDRSCRTPGCRVPAGRAELDHSVEHEHGGPSHRGNLEARCKRHHTVRHRTGTTVARAGTTTTLTQPNGMTFEVTLDKDVILVNE